MEAFSLSIIAVVGCAMLAIPGAAWTAWRWGLYGQRISSIQPIDHNDQAGPRA
jgi:hypothetical protein